MIMTKSENIVILPGCYAIVNNDSNIILQTTDLSVCVDLAIISDTKYILLFLYRPQRTNIIS
jgi:hypothetical protein